MRGRWDCLRFSAGTRGRGASWDALPRGAWERSVTRGGSVARTLASARRDGDAERLGMHYLAERGNDQWHARIGGTDAGASAADGDAERLGMHYLAECGNDQWHTRFGGMDAGASAAGWGRGASWNALPRGAWERSVARADRWHGRWRQRGGMGTRSVLGCITTRSVGTISGTRRIVGTDAGDSAAG